MDAFKKFGKKLRKGKGHSQSSQTPPHTANASTTSVVHATPTASSPLAGESSNRPTEARTRTGSRSAPWIERVIFLLKTTKEAAELGGEVAAPLKAACGIAITLLEAVQATNENREAWSELIQTIKDHTRSFDSGLQLGGIDVDGDSPLAKALKDYQDLALEVLKQVFEAAPDTIATEDIRQASTLAKLCDVAKRLGASKWEAGSIKQYRDRLNDSQRNIMSTLVIYMAARTERRDDDRLLETLRVAGLDELKPPEGCMKGTRLDILENIHRWSRDITQPNILWVKGHPGCGKSAIARSAAGEFEDGDDVELGSIFVFQRQQSALLNPTSLWRTVAFELAQKLPAVRESLIKNLRANKIKLNNPDIDQLFQHLIIDPLSGVTGSKPVVVVIDALDECGGVEGRSSRDRVALLRTLKKWPSISRNVKLLVTGRPEEDLERTFRPTGVDPLVVEIPVGKTVDLASQASRDIRLFLIEEFKLIAERYWKSLDADWPGLAIIDELTKIASGLFIWAATVIRLVNAKAPAETLKHIRDQPGSGSLDALYAEILSSSFPNPTNEDLETFHAVVGAIIVAETPLSDLTLSQILGIELSTVDHICQSLHSVLETGDLLQFRHQSFVDFLLERGGPERQFGIRRGREHGTLAIGCLRRMDKDLRFNICDIPSSYIANTDIPGIDLKITKQIPPSLAYSCYYWGRHLGDTTAEAKDIDNILQLIHQFQYQKFLFWLEVLSLTKRLVLGPPALSALIQWLQKQVDHQDVVTSIKFADDMLQFIGCFGAAISCSLPHIYLSALPLAPFQSMVSNTYKPLYPQTLSIKRGGNHDWPSLRYAITAHANFVNSVAFSPDGAHIVSGSRDKTIRVWDAASGELIGEPLQGHTDWVTSVAFSPDGAHIVSGSDDKTIRVWDAASGEAIGEPLQGHTGSVLSVAFSPDGAHIVSGSYDKTIRVWDAASGEPIGEPLQGHTSSVTSVAFSPDGAHIVSGSHDKTIQVWDAASGELIGEPLQGHTHWVTSVAFSPDGAHIVSGSGDKTIRVWDAASGEPIGEPLQGHTDWVRSVAFSPDGAHIVSGSDDKTIRVWDAASGEAIGEPFQGHTNWVSSVAFSPDGAHIVSGSGDKTIQVWDAASGEPIGEPLQGHTSSVTSVAFSPDGAHIVSGSDDQTIRVWDAASGEPIGEPLQGHTSSVTSVAFSPDGAHIVSGSHDQTIQVLSTPSLESMTHKSLNLPSFVNSGHINSNGWIHGPGKELILWVPSDLHMGLSCVNFPTIGGNFTNTTVDTSHFKHGASWTQCGERQSS